MPIFLVLMAEISNIIAIGLVVLLLVVMLSYLCRLTMSHDLFAAATSTVFYPRKQQSIPMVKVANPFTFKLTNPSQCTLERVNCSVSSQYPCSVNAFWGINLNHFHLALALNWHSLKERLREDSFLVSPCGLRSPTQNLTAVTDHLVTIKPPAKIKPSDLGKAPRQKYPLVILIVREDDCNDNLDMVVAMAIIVHVKDTECSMESRVLLQYLKQANGRTCCLKPLYIADSDNVDVSYGTTNYSDENKKPVCVVCQSNSISHVILPCRHTCVCQSCFHLIDKCPLCRSIIESFFRVTNDNNQSLVGESSNQADEFPLRQRNI